jgi:hypothetical protein
MILFLISIILFVLKYFGVLNIAWFWVSLPAMTNAAFAYFLFMKAEFDYMKNFNRAKKEEQEQ